MSPAGSVTAEDIVRRVEGLQSALAVADDRLDDAVVEDGRSALARSRDRLRLSAEHTVVTLAGATGSGKSSLFNALTGLELAAVGARRPTTSWATACAWDPQGATDLLTWLGVPPRHQVSRLSTLDGADGDTALRGLVLLDLPDHDSTEVAHHLEVDRLVQCADLLVWVLDPQKYADAALHERYLRPYAGHAEVMVVVLNQVDRLSEHERAQTLADVRRLLVDDGLVDVQLLGVSATGGHGLAELEALLVQRLAAKQGARDRVAADVAAVAERLVEHGGAQEPAGTDPEVRGGARRALVNECTAASGADVGADVAPDVAARRAEAVAGWPPLLPLRRDTGPGDVAGAVGAVDLVRLDVAARTYADTVSEGLQAPWVRNVRRSVEGAGERLAAGLTRPGAARPPAPLAASVRVLACLQGLLLLAVVVGTGWQLAGSVAAVQGVPAGLLVAVLGVVLGLVLDRVGGGWAAGRAAARARAAADESRSEVAGVVDEAVVRPVDNELDAHATWRAGIAAARTPQSQPRSR